MMLKGRLLILFSLIIFIIIFAISNLLSAIFAVAGFFMLSAYIHYRKDKAYKEIFREQLIVGIEMIAGALKTGMSFQQALVYVIKETKEPFSAELKSVMDKIILGDNTEKALYELAEKHKLEELYLVSSAFGITRDAGGNLAEVLSNVVTGMREKIRLEKQIEVLTAQGKLSGFIVGALPFIMLILMYFMDKELILPLFTTLLGWIIVVFALLMELAGIFFIRKIIKIDY